MRIQQLEVQISELQAQMLAAQQQIEGLTSGLAHVVDVIVPELARADSSELRRAELARIAARVRTQFIGEAPAPVSN